ncbi:MAG: hypothetical protein L0Y71_09135 [Gemmataceae bacterium]|nr:hypothetical protein [Gemmataceae bacterium]
MRTSMFLAIFLLCPGHVPAEPQSAKQRFLALNPDYKAGVTQFYAQEYLPGTVRSMTGAIRSPGFRDADADRVLRVLIGNFLDQWIEGGGQVSEGVREEVVAPMDVEVKRLVRDEDAYRRYLAWRHIRNSASNPLAFLMPLHDSGPPDAHGRGEPPIRVLVGDVAASDGAAAKRLRGLKFVVVDAPWDKVDPDRAEDIDVIFLATSWGDQLALAALDAKKDAFHRFIRRGGGLVASQPNPAAFQTCTPALLPYPITFHYMYDQKDTTRLNLAHDHFITEDLAGHEMPFPADPMLKVDPRYRVLAKQKSTGFPSLVAASSGDGRVVVQTANESYASTIPIGDEILRRMIVWAAGREPTGR